MKIRNIDCRGCNNHCPLKVTVDENKKVIDVEGNCCHRGVVSAKRQLEPRVTFTTRHSSDNPRTLNCTGCPNHCQVKVTLKGKKITKIDGAGCRRAVISICRQLGLPANSSFQV